jgi:hypothetical protein
LFRMLVTGVVALILCVFLSLPEVRPRIVNVPFSFAGDGGQENVLQFDDSAALSGSGDREEVYRQMEPFCTDQGLQNEECDGLVQYLHDQDYLQLTAFESHQSALADRRRHVDTIQLTEGVCLSQQVVDYCAEHSLSHKDCDELYTDVRNLSSSSPVSVSCTPPPFAPPPSRQVLSLQALESRATQEAAAASTAAIDNDDDAINVWVFWDGGESRMPPVLQYVHRHNQLLAARHGHRLRLVTLASLEDYLPPPPAAPPLHPLFGALSPAQKADYARTRLLLAHGGLWLDCDFLLLGDLSPLLGLLARTHTSFLLTEEFPGKAGNAVLGGRAGSAVLGYLAREQDRLLDRYSARLAAGRRYMHRDFLGPGLMRQALSKFGFVSHPPQAPAPGPPGPGPGGGGAQSPVLLLLADLTSRGMHFAVWSRRPAYQHALWLRPSAAQAEREAGGVRASSLGVAGLWTLGSAADSGANPFWRDAVFNDTRSVFYQLVVAAQDSGHSSLQQQQQQENSRLIFDMRDKKHASELVAGGAASG